ncbi:MAG: transglutaminase [Paenibacillus sp.]|nr:transglutaminase [Paenibacillus sp.]
MSPPERSFIRDGIAAGLLFALLLEWLRPLLDMSEWSGVYRISPFMLAFGLFVAVDWLRLSPWIGWPFKVFVSLSIVAFVFDSAAFAHPSWLIHYAELTMKDAIAIADEDFASISPDNRTMLFLLGWSMMIHVIYASVVERKQSLWFVAATLLYLLGLQLWPGVNTSTAIIRTVWFGFLLMGLLQFSRLESRFALRQRTIGWPIGLLTAVPLLLAAVVAAGLWLPPEMKSGVMKPLDTGELIGRFTSWNTDVSGNEFLGGQDAARTGYGGDDSVLGGAIRQDESIAFTAATEELTYWRGEAKTFYTGFGWENGGSMDESASLLPSRSIGQEVTVVDPALAGRLFAGGRVERVEELIARSGRTMVPEESVINVYGAYLLTELNDKDPLRSYKLKVAVPVERSQWGTSGDRTDSPVTGMEADDSTGMAPGSESRLEAGEGTEAGAGAAAETTGNSEAVVEAADRTDATADTQAGHAALADISTAVDTVPSKGKFGAELQLPSSLPARVRLLAETVAMDQTDDYGRAGAIETFLKTNYTYRLDVPEPPKTQADFADTFLFESKVGYCDYFSTSMVVMLRSVGIPARWVKGFSPGEVTGRAGVDGVNGDMLQVTVRNLNAHSWVEAYIAGNGWMTFDPTPGNTVPPASAPVFAQAVQASAQPDKEKTAAAAGMSKTIAAWMHMTRERLVSSWESRDWKGTVGALWLPVTAVILLLPLLFMTWYRLMSRQAVNRSNHGPYSHSYNNGKRAFAYRALDKLWIVLFRKLGGKQPALTVREYVESLPLAEVGKREALRDFVKQYEAVRYGGAPLPRSAKRSAKELWRRIKER